MTEIIDVLVVGAGPAGLSSAFFLRHMGDDLEVLTLDRMEGRRRSRYHSICGEGISVGAFSELTPIRPWAVKDRVDKAVINWPGGVRTTQRLDGFIIDRPAFLDRLEGMYREEGGHSAVGSLISLKQEEGFYTAVLYDGTELRSRYVIGADGAFSTVRKQIFGTRPLRMLAVERYLVEAETLPETLTFHMGESYGGGYRWEFPCGGLVNTGFPAGTSRLDEYVDKACRFLPFGGVPQVTDGNVLLVGDAAGQANPVSFGGIRTSMVAGKRAAKAVIAGKPERYRRWWERSRLSSPWYMKAHETLAGWSDGDMERAAAPFQGRARLRPLLRRAMTSPRDFHMYIAYGLAFRESW